MKYGDDNGQGRIMQNNFLEGLTKTPIWLPLLIFYTISVSIFSYTIYKNSFNIFLSLIIYVVGFFAFTLLEYFGHRFVFHMHPDTEKKKRIQYMFHGVHHDYPRDKDRLAMPVFVSLLLSLVFLTIFYLIRQKLGIIFWTGFIAGYATYLFAHYAIHRFKPPRNFLKNIWIHHNVHHYAAPNHAFGVTTLLWDRIFGTMPPKSK